MSQRTFSKSAWVQAWGDVFEKWLQRSNSEAMDETAQQRILELVSSIIRQGHELHGLLSERMRDPWLDPVEREINLLQFEVAEAYGINPGRIVGKSRLARDAQARLVAMSLCRQLTSATLEQVGRLFQRH